MTKINKLVLRGFKSFARKTELVFGDNFNCVLGPNGSGKSNIIDALCFVLGKTSAKGLRAEKSANLIYNGGKKKNPAKDAEVSIYFDNSKKIFPTDDVEVKISRIVKQSGQSTYKINDKTRTRQQMLDLMSLAKVDPDGYNIILQGDIVRFVEMSTGERRSLIEEIAGINVYEDKKKKAVNELNKVEERLKEADIILSERQVHLQELKKERNQALKFKELKDKINQNKATQLHIQITKKSDSLKKLSDGIRKEQLSLESYEKDIEQLKKVIDDKRSEIDSINKEIEQKGEKEQVELHKIIENLKVDLATAKQRLETVIEEQEKIVRRKEELQKNISEVEGKIKRLNSEKEQIAKTLEVDKKQVEQIEEKIKVFKTKNKLDDAGSIEQSIETIDKSAEEQERNILSLRQDQQELLRKKDKLEFQVEGIDEKINKVLEVEKENKEAVEKLKAQKADFKKTTLELSKSLEESSSMAAQLETARAKVLSAKEELAKLTARQASILEFSAGNNAIRTILDLKNKMRGIYGTVSELGEVQSKYSQALQVVAASKLNSIVVEDDKVAAECIKHLKTNRLGTASFLPLNKIRSRPISPEALTASKAVGAHGLAIDLVSYDVKFKKVFSYAFGSAIVVDNIDVARRIGIGVAKMATLEGDLTDLSGAMHGGFRSKTRGSGFKEKELNRDIKEYEEVINQKTSVIERLQSNQKANDDSIERLRNHKASLEGDIITLEKTLHLDSDDMQASRVQKSELQEEIGSVDKTLSELSNNISSANKEIAQVKIEKQQLRNKISELRNPRLLAELNALEQKRTELREKNIRYSSDIKNIEENIGSILSSEVENTQRIIKQLEKERLDFTDEQKGLKEKIKTLQEDVKIKEAAQKEFYQKYKGLFTKRQATDDAMRASEQKLAVAQEKTKDLELKINGVSLEQARIKAEKAALDKEFEEYKDVKLLKNVSEADVNREINAFERMMENIGSVNMKALEIYDVVEKEYKELLNKKETLGLEREDVLLLMNEIESKKRELFLQTFDVVNHNFKETYKELQAKGEVNLMLEDPNDPFNGGVLIKVRIVGNKYLDIRSLSGGEKTMAALAFIFSIQEHDPASFYLLDEVDAALDKHNSEKLSNLIRDYSKKAQYIMISHNDGIISEADQLYGVSMQADNISKVVSLKI
ncbi:chromosome segregation protein SMC [Candidatus Woesearchaeota archaeon]|nr:chromosome segregation protein SMC [Candidatus Woesearchaeota archaeon]